jgi:hypothetical protein
LQSIAPAKTWVTTKNAKKAEKPAADKVEKVAKPAAKKSEAK